MKTQLPTLLLFLFVPGSGALLSRHRRSLSPTTKKTSPLWLVTRFLSLNLSALTALILSRPLLHPRFLPKVVYSNSK